MKYGQFGRCAVFAAKYCVESKLHPEMAWDRAIREVSKSISVYKKGCPKAAFLGLCEDGLVKGVAAAGYTRSTHNKMYAVQAYRLLEQGVAQELLWQKVAGPQKSHNGQMDVVVALWNEGFLA